MPLSTGQVLNNRYRVVKLLGQGGFGAVYRAWDINLNIPVALKENFDPTGGASRQFALEANLLATLHHPNLPKVTDHFSLPGQGQYLVMEYIEGEDLSAKVQNARGPLPEAEVITWASQILDALDYLHHQNPPVIHRDIKPGNIRITSHGQAILVDFGIAKVSEAGGYTMTAAKAVTPGYSPIENYGSGLTDGRSDIYALGATLFCALTGFDPPESSERIGARSRVYIRQANPAVTPQVEAAIAKAMEIQPAKRFQSAAEFLAALRARPSPAMPAPVGPTELIVARTQAQSAAYIAPTQAVHLDEAAPIDTPPEKRSSLPLVLVSAGAVAAILLLFASVAFLWMSASKTSDPTPTAVVAAVNPAATTPTLMIGTVAAGSSSNNPFPTDPPAPADVEFVPPTQPPVENPTLEPPPVEPLPSGPLMLELDRNYHCRSGPAEAYEVLRDLSAGEQYELIGVSYDSSWYLVRLNDPRTRKKLCWVGGGQILGSPVGLPACQWEGDGYTENYSCSQ